MAASTEQIDALIAAVRARADAGDDEANLAFGTPGSNITSPVINDEVVQGTFATGEGIKDTSGGSNAMKSLLKGVADWTVGAVNPFRVVDDSDADQFIQLQARFDQLSGSSTTTNLIAHSREGNKKQLLLDCIHDGSGGAAGALGFVFRIGDSAGPYERIMHVRDDGIVLVNGPFDTDATLDSNQFSSGAACPARLFVRGSIVLGNDHDDLQSQLPSGTTTGNRFFINDSDGAFQIATQDGAGRVNITWNAVRDGSGDYRVLNGGEFPLRFRMSTDFTWYLVSGAAPANPGDSITWVDVLHLDQGNNNVGINTASPSGSYALDVAGQVHASAFPVSSDENLKENVAQLSDCMSKLRNVRGVAFNWNQTYKDMRRDTNKREIGIIAQEIEPHCPELVQDWEDRDPDTDELKATYKAVDYSRLTAVLIEALKEVDARVTALEGA